MMVEDLLEKLNKTSIPKGLDLLINCLNPEHEDTNPSMRVDKITGLYHCFSCGMKGNLLRDYGYTPNVLDNMSIQIKNKIQKLLTNSLTIPEGAMPFKHEHRGICTATYNKFEAFTHPNYEGRIVFPLRNYSDNIYAFLGRYIHSDISPKYKVFPNKTPLGLQPKTPEVYKGSLILVEGLFDVLNLYTHGLKNVITCFGTKTAYQTIIENLAPYEILGVNKIYIMFDGDKAGHDSARKMEHIIPDKFNPEIITLPENTDPGQLTKDQITEIKRGLYK